MNTSANAGRSLPHYCKVTGCCVTLENPRSHFCQRHWVRVPEQIKRKIESFQQDKTKTWEYRLALLEAVDAVDALEACQPQTALTK